MNKPSDSNDPHDGLPAILAPVMEDLRAVGEVLDEVLRPPAEQVRPLLERVRRFHGKMLRPAFTLLGGRCFGEIGAEHHRLGAVVELIHTATLVHDDVLDASDMRRRMETVNARWGNHAAVLLGDFIFSTAFALSANLENRLASRYLSWISGVVCQGEMMQVIESGNLDLDEESYFEVIEKKTAYLFAAAARVGAEYSEAPESAADALADYGLRIGTAFQIVDDCLDLDGVEENVGKTLGTDARQGKVTLPVIHYFRSGPEAGKAKLREMLASGEGDRRREEIRDMLEEGGSLDHARNVAARLAEEAIERLSEVPESIYRDTFEELARYSLTRRR